MDDRRYVVVIDGYEGIEDIFGPFNAHDALAVHTELKQDCVREWDTTYDYKDPEWLWHFQPKTYDEGLQQYIDAHCYYSSIRDDIATSKYGICDLPKDPDRVCIMKGVEPGNRMECCCEDFPNRIPNAQTWWH